MGKIKKKIKYLLGGFLVFALKSAGVFAQMQIDYGNDSPARAAYGVGPAIEQPLWVKILLVVLSPVFMVSVAVVAVILGVVLVIRHRKKKKDNNQI